MITGKPMLLSATALVAASVLAGLSLTNAAAETSPARERQSVKAAPTAAPVRKTSPYSPASVSKSARSYYVAVSGVDELKVRRTGSNLIRFSYRVADPERAKALADRKATPYLIGHSSRAVLQVPVMDKVGPLRQSTTPQPGQEYWMVFSNKGDMVKLGERVSVVIGAFRADGLKVE